MLLSKQQPLTSENHASTYSTRYFSEEVTKHDFPAKSIPANAAYQLVHDELNMDGNPALNLASFVTTWMEPEAVQLIHENLHKNFIDRDEYPQTEVIHHRCVSMLARLFNAPQDCTAIGAATIGSSEAIMLGLLAHKWSWKKKRQAAGLPTDKPNLIFGADVHVCWEKFAKYFDVEMRIIPLSKGSFTITQEEVDAKIDENTIAVGAILGTTYSGQADPIQEINDLLLRIKQEKGWDIPLHVDAASGGFVVPFVQPDFLWDFRLEQVKSINVSGHKYGLVYPGIGWIIWRDETDFPEELSFKVNYLGGWMPTYTLNFSCSSANVIAQYYNFLRLGREGYTRIMNNCVQNAQYLSKQLAALEQFEMVNEAQLLPIVALKLKDATQGYTVFDLSRKLRERGWIVPAYIMPPHAEDIAIIRIVVREHFSRDMADILYKDIVKACDYLARHKGESDKGPTEKKHAIC